MRFDSRQHGGAALLAVLTVLLACSGEPMKVEAQTSSARAPKTPQYSFRVVKAFPHDPTAFTQGLVFADGMFYESTGLRGESTLRKVKPETGQVIQQVKLEDRFFAEGLALLGEELLQLTWQEHVGFAYDRKTLKQIRTFFYPTEGWGLASDGKRLIMSDGSSRLYFLDLKTQTTARVIEVKEGGRPVHRLNELEFVRGELWANVWTTDRIARIDPETGRVTGWIDLTGLLRPEARGPEGDVLNGIAWDRGQDRIFVTGKKWPWMFQIEIIPAG